jgi:hypothetical protein
MKIPEEYLNTLNRMSADDFAEWLLEGLRCWEEYPPKNIPFFPIGLLFSRHEDVGMQLAELYEKLDAPTQTKFKQGLALSITRCRNVDEWQTVLRNMVWLAKTLKAAAALQPILLLLKGFLKTANAQESLRSRAYLINILASWVEEPLVTQALEQLLEETGYFYKTDVPIVFLNLLKVHPEKLAAYAKQCRSYFVALEKEQQLYVRSLTLGLVDKMGLDNLARYLPDLNSEDDLSLRPDNANGEGWLLKMLDNTESTITFSRDKTGSFVCCGKRRLIISDKKLTENYNFGYWLNDYLEKRQVPAIINDDNSPTSDIQNECNHIFKHLGLGYLPPSSYIKFKSCPLKH